MTNSLPTLDVAAPATENMEGDLLRPRSLLFLCLLAPTLVAAIWLSVFLALPVSRTLPPPWSLMVEATMGYVASAGLCSLVLLLSRLVLGRTRLAALFLAPDIRRILDTLLDPRLFALILAALFAMMPGVPGAIDLGLSLYAGLLFGVTSVAGRQTRLALRHGEAGA